MSNKHWHDQRPGDTKKEARGTTKTGKKTTPSASFKEANTNNIVPKR